MVLLAATVMVVMVLVLVVLVLVVVVMVLVLVVLVYDVTERLNKVNLRVPSTRGEARGCENGLEGEGV